MRSRGHQGGGSHYSSRLIHPGPSIRDSSVQRSGSSTVQQYSVIVQCRCKTTVQKYSAVQWKKYSAIVQCREGTVVQCSAVAVHLCNSAVNRGYSSAVVQQTSTGESSPQKGKGSEQSKVQLRSELRRGREQQRILTGQGGGGEGDNNSQATLILDVLTPSSEKKDQKRN